MGLRTADQAFVKVKSCIDAIRRLNERLEQAKQDHKEKHIDALLALSDATCDLDLSDEDEILLLLDDLYWNFPEIAVKDIAALFGMKASQVTASVGRSGSGITCKSCGGEVLFKTRTSRVEKKGMCDECKREESQRAAEERRLSWEKYNPVVVEEPEEEQVDLRSMEYGDYLQTDHWKSVRAAAFRRAGYACQLCNSKGKLHTHHRTYVRRGNESPDDLIVLCAECHETFHFRDGQFRMPDSHIPESERYV